MTDDDDVSQLRKGALELAILALLDAAPSYGGELVARLAAFRGLEAGSGTVYPLLTRLKRAEMVETTWQESPVGPPRKYYRLTDRGRAARVAQTRAWEQLSGAMNDVLTKGRRR